MVQTASTLITLSAGCQVVGSMLSQVLGVDSRLNPLVHEPAWSESLIPELRSLGITIGGTLRFALLSAGLPESALPLRMTEVDAARCALEWARPGDVLALLVHSAAARAEVLALLEARVG